MENIYLYPCFDKWFRPGGTVWFYSDPHFNDPESQFFRKSFPSTEKQIKLINSKVGRNDTLVILGDVHDIEPIKQLKAGYKVLILGNHDKGKSYYQRKVTKKKYIGRDKCAVCGSIVTYESDKGGFNYFDETAQTGWCSNVNCICSRPVIKNYEGIDSDNKLFDEVYDGCLMISDKLILSHEPVEFKYAFNIHGHDHSFTYDNIYKLMFQKFDCDLDSDKYLDAQLEIIKENKLNHLNLCCEWTGYLPVNIKQIFNSGILKNIPNIHRETIDGAIERKENNIITND